MIFKKLQGFLQNVLMVVEGFLVGWASAENLDDENNEVALDLRDGPVKPLIDQRGLDRGSSASYG